jgi:hypothetical protein
VSGVIPRVRVSSIFLAAFLALVAVATVVGAVPAQAEPLPNGVPGTWALILNEEFSANGLNTALWTPEWPSGPMSGQCTSPSLVSQPGNGYLYLQVRAQESTCGGTKHPDTGSLVESNPADGKPGHSGFLYSYGYVEWHVYIVGWGGEEQGCPRGGCIPDWPALWSFPENEETEIDTMEGLKGQACFHFWRHLEPAYQVGGCAAGSYAGWHTYGVDWEPGLLKYYYDGTKVWEYSSGDIKSTPQYLIMDEVPPGSYGGHLVVPDEIVVDYARVWQHPVPPSATTGSATGVQPLQATLNGTVNPNGFDTHYYFQYGTSTSYGSTTGEVDAGSGTSAVPASGTATSLSPGTTYHYRIVASNSAGTAYGGDQTLTTPGPVEAVTGAATGLLEAQATLNGTVNPRGYDAKYYFQYGPSTSYGSSTLEGDAGSGVGAVPESGKATGLVPGSPYHYRLVATSGGVTSYGQDKTFWLTEEASPRWVVRNPATGDIWVYYVNSKSEIAEWNWNGAAWNGGAIGGGAASGASPSVVRDPVSGDTWVYYVNSKSEIAEWNWNGAAWHSGTIGGSVTSVTSPSVVRSPATGDIWVYYVNSKGEIAEWNWNGAAWNGGTIGGNVKTGSSPSVVHDRALGDTWVYYMNNKSEMAEWNWNGAAWNGGTL